jgi:hypothetical protein
LIETNLDRDAEAGRRGGDADWTSRKRRRQARGWEPLTRRKYSPLVTSRSGGEREGRVVRGLAVEPVE